MASDSVQDEMLALADQLADSEPGVVRKALTRIASLARRQPELVDHLATLLSTLEQHLSHADPNVCSACCWAIGHVGSRRPDWVTEVLPELAELTRHQDAKVREMAVWALGGIGRAEPRIVEPHLSGILNCTKDDHGRVRLSAIWVCENIATRCPEWFAEHLSLFIGMLDDPDTKHMRGEVPELFRVIGKRRPDLVECAVPELRRKLEDSDRVTKIHAAGALRAIEKAKGALKRD